MNLYNFLELKLLPDTIYPITFLLPSERKGIIPGKARIKSSKNLGLVDAKSTNLNPQDDNEYHLKDCNYVVQGVLKNEYADLINFLIHYVE